MQAFQNGSGSILTNLALPFSLSDLLGMVTSRPPSGWFIEDCEAKLLLRQRERYPDAILGLLNRKFVRLFFQRVRLYGVRSFGIFHMNGRIHILLVIRHTSYAAPVAS